MRSIAQGSTGIPTDGVTASIAYAKSQVKPVVAFSDPTGVKSLVEGTVGLSDDTGSGTVDLAGYQVVAATFAVGTGESLTATMDIAGVSLTAMVTSSGISANLLVSGSASGSFDFGHSVEVSASISGSVDFYLSTQSGTSFTVSASGDISANVLGVKFSTGATLDSSFDISSRSLVLSAGPYRVLGEKFGPYSLDIPWSFS